MKQADGVDVILVEDDEDHAEIVRRTLLRERPTARFRWFQDGVEALTYFQDNVPSLSSGHPRVILLDLRLPKIDGLEILRRLRSNTGLSRIPVVVMSSSKAEEDVARAYEYRANSYVIKPINATAFRQLTKDLGEYWLAWNHPPR